VKWQDGWLCIFGNDAKSGIAIEVEWRIASQMNSSSSDEDDLAVGQ